MKEKLINLIKTKRFKWIMSIAFIFAVLVPTIMVFADNKPTFYLEAVEEKSENPVDLNKLHRGDKFRLKVMLRDVKEFQALNCTIKYDSRAFKYVGSGTYKDEDEFEESKIMAESNDLEDSSNPNQRFVSTSAIVKPKFEEGYTYNGRIVTITFEVLSEARDKYNFDFRTDSPDGTVSTYIKKLISAGDDDTPADYEDIDFDTEAKQAYVEVPATDINLSVPNDVDMIVGDSKDLTITPVPSDTTTEENVTYDSSNKEAADIEGGKIVAKKTGNTTITVNAYGIEKTFNVKVTNPLKELYFEKETEVIKGVDGQVQLNVKTRPEDPDETKLKWESLNSQVATVDQTGLVTGHQNGQAVIKVMSEEDNDISATITVDVVIPVTSANIDKQEINIEKGENDNVTINYEPKEANTDIDWNIDNSDVISITKQTTPGKIVTNVNGVKGGSANLTGTLKNCNEGVECSFSVKVNVNVTLQSISIQKDSKNIENLDIYPGESANLSVALNPSDATVSADNTISWSSKNGNVQITKDGKVTGVNPNTDDVITATYAGKEASINVHVKVPVSGSSILPSNNINLITNCNLKDKGKCEEELSVAFTSSIPDVLPDEKPTVTWGIKEGSPKDVVSVTNGKVKALKGGSTIVTASYTTFDGETTVLEANIKVSVALEGISFSENNVVVNRGESINIPNVILTPSNATVDKNSIEYEYNSDIIKISNGKLTALSKGKTELKAKLDGEEATMMVTVAVPVKNIIVKNDDEEINSLVLARNSGTGLVAEVVPNDADDTNVLWGIAKGSATDVVSIDKAGNVKALKRGVTKITATAGGFTKTIDVRVIVPVESFTAPSQLDIYKGEVNKKQIKTTITPNDADDREITWTVEDPTVAKIDQNGYVTGLREGSTNITGRLKNGMEVTTLVNVKIIPLDDIEIELPARFLKGRPASVVVKPIPENSTEFENLVYESSDEDIFTVDQNGVITGLKEGVATLTVTVGGTSKEVEIKIIEIHAESIDANVPSSKLGVGEEMRIEPYANPLDCTDDLHYTFTSSDPSIATVDQTGLVKGLKKGTVKITITADNGMTVTKTITVTENSQIQKSINEISPNTGVDSNIAYVIISILSFIGMVLISHKRNNI